MTGKSKNNSPNKQAKKASSATRIYRNNAAAKLNQRVNKPTGSNAAANHKSEKTTKRRKGSKPAIKALKIALMLLVFSVIVVGAGALSIVYSYVKDTPEFNPGDLRPAVTSYVFDRNGVELAGLYDEQNRVEVPLEGIPEHVIQAFIAIEDERFYDHYGVDPTAIARAFVINLRQGDWTEQGGSTITQQLIKNAFLTPEKTFRRKIQEAWLSLKMERQFSKSEILEIYLNQIYFAHGAYGIEAAANVYFNKNVEDLTVAEAAMLAGIPRSPNYYSPYKNPEIARQRQGLVLSKMQELDFISSAQFQQARDTELTFAEPPSREYPYPYFVDYVLHHELIRILTDMPEYESREEAYEVIYNSGLRVYTTLDTEAQQITEDILNDESLYPQQTIRIDMTKLKNLLADNNYSSYPEEAMQEDGIPQPQSAAVVANPVTGEVFAMVGGREYSEYNQDLRYLSRRQPGSAAKPIFSYAPAFEEGLMTPGTVIDDAPFARGSWGPENFDRRFRGLVTVREALVRSLNVPAVRAFDEITPQVGLQYAERMGISTLHPDDYHLATAIGGMTHGVTAFDMAQAFGVLGNQGIKTKLHTVKRIEDPSGQVLYEYRRDPDDVLSPQTAYLITDILKDVVQSGTAARLSVGRPIAAKTGTTSDNRDAYLVAYTPDLVVSFWMGHDIQTLGQIQGGSGSTIVFMNEIVTRLMKDKPALDFERPPGISGPVSICSKSGLRPGEHCPDEAIISELFPTHLLPQDTCEMHVEMEVCAVSGLLPGDYCPEQEIVNEIFLNRPEFEVTDGRWRGGAGRGPEDAGLMSPSEPCDIHTQPAPRPSDLTAYLLHNPPRAHLWWNRDLDIAEYRVYRRAAGEEDFVLLTTLPGSSNQFLDDDLEMNTLYTYHLVAINTQGVRSEPAALNLQVPARTEEDRSREEDRQPPDDRGPEVAHPSPDPPDDDDDEDDEASGRS